MATVKTPTHIRKSGPKNGKKHSGQFVKGDPRINRHPAAMPTVKKEFMSLMREHTDEAIACLTKCMADDTSPWRERIAAAELTLAHAYGRPVDRVAVANMGNGDGVGAVQQMDYAQLKARAAAFLVANMPADMPDEEVIDEQ